jgi:predicted MPP superfamily phosphohydrolase
MGVLFILLTCVGAMDVMRTIGAVIHRVVGDTAEPDPSRRTFVARLLAGLVLLVGGSASIAALRSGLGRVVIREIRVPLSRLPPDLDGTTIVQLSDVHVGPTIGLDFVREIVARTNALSPDIVAITGDLVDGSVRRLGGLVRPLSELRAKHGVYFVTGNHEYYSGAESWCRELTRLGIRVLRNERVEIGERHAGFTLAGVDDFSADRFGGDHGADLPRALDGRDPDRPVVLLAHQPRAIFEAERLGVSLQLSGHTHGGQIWPWKYLVRLQQPVVSGLARFGRAMIYVSNGTGYWGPPMRLGAPAEITKLVLVSAA